jgi:hypothetical protein
VLFSLSRQMLLKIDYNCLLPCVVQYVILLCKFYSGKALLKENQETFVDVMLLATILLYSMH